MEDIQDIMDLKSFLGLIVREYWPSLKPKRGYGNCNIYNYSTTKLNKRTFECRIVAVGAIDLL